MKRDLKFFQKCLDLTVLGYWTINYGKWNWKTRSRFIYRELEASRVEKEYDLKNCKFLNNDDTDSQCMIYQDESNTLWVVYRASDSKTDWALNEAFSKAIVPFDRNPKEKLDRVHGGFFASFMGLRDQVSKIVAESYCDNINVVGFSQGSAVATLCALDLQYNFKEKNIVYVGFGCPRVGNEIYKEKFNKYIKEFYMFRRGMDVVSHVPMLFLGFSEMMKPIRLGPWKPYLSVFDHFPFRYLRDVRKKIKQVSSETSS